MKQGEIWIINLDPTIGAEIRKRRPAVIVNNDDLGKLPLKVIIPITDWKEKYSVSPWMIKLSPDGRNKLTKESSADCFQVRSVSQERFISKIGEVYKEQLENIFYALSLIFSFKK